MAVSGFEALELLNKYGPATAEELARHRFRPLDTIQRQNTLQPLRMPSVGDATQRIGDAAALQTALFLLQTQRKAISVTTGRGKGRRTWWMTPQQGWELMAGIRRVLG